MAKDDVVSGKRLTHFTWALVLLVMLIPVNAGAVIINNTVSVNSNAGLMNSSVDVVSIFATSSTIELLQYAPAPVTGSSPVPVSATEYSNSGLPAGPFLPSGDPLEIGGATISMPTTVDLLTVNVYKTGEPIFIRVTDADQNANPLMAETVLVTVTTPISGDSVVLRLAETGVNTGVFVGYVQSSNAAVTVNDNVISVAINESINVNYVDVLDGTDVSADAALVDPYGTVFSTADGTPLDGATVTIIDVGTGLPATVFGDDGVSIFPATVTTGGVAVDSGANVYNFPAGNYRFPYVSPGTYRLDIIPPAGYSGPSTMPTATIQTLPGAPYSIVIGSRNENFVVNPGPALHIDVPLDSSASGLFINKRSVKNSVAIGEYLQYQLEISNTAAVGLTNTNIVDMLPAGFRYEPGSAKLDGIDIADPGISRDGRTLTFSLGAVPVATTLNLRYVVAVSTGARAGKAVNRARGSADGGVVSNTAQATVEVMEELIPNRSHLMGRVIMGGCDASVGEVGAVSIQLQSQAVKDFIDYSATLKVDTVTVKDLSAVVTLPGTLEYVFGSALKNGIYIIDPVVNGNQLIFNLDKGEANSSTVISFRTRSRHSSYGEFYIRAYAEFKDPSSEEKQGTVLQRTPIVLNKIKDFSRILRPRFDSLSAKLKTADLEDLDELIYSLSGQDIEKIHIIGHTDKQPIRARSQSIYKNNEELSHARARSVADHMQKALKLKDEQIQVTGMGSKKQLYYSERLSKEALTASQQLSFNRRVEVLVQLKGQGKKSRFIISRGDSGLQQVETVGPRGEMKGPSLAENYPGLKNVRLFLEDGRYVDTDEKGLYHFEGLKPGTHVVQVDTDSLPDHMEVYSCEKNTRFAGTPYSRFVDLQGGSLWRSDFYVRNKPSASLKGDVGVQLTSKLVDGVLHYDVLLNGDGLAISKRRLLVDLPYGTQYVQGSSVVNGTELADPSLIDGQLVFDLGDSDSKTWQSELAFRALQTNTSEGEFSTLAVLDYRTADGKSRQSSAAVNTLVRQAESLNNLIYLGYFQGTETGLPDSEQQRLEGAIDFLRGKTIRQIEVVVTTEDQQIRESLRALYPDIKALAQARADVTGAHIVASLKLFEDQVKRIAKVIDRPEGKQDGKVNRLPRQQMEIFATLANEHLPKDIHVKEADSGMVKNTIIGVIPQQVANEEQQQREQVTVDGIQGLVDQQRVVHRIMPVSILLDSRLQLVFEIDGVEVNKDRLAQKIINNKTGRTLHSYIGIDLGAPGEHTLTVRGMDPFGNARFKQTLDIVRTGDIDKIRVLESSGNVADGKTPVRIRLQLIDAAGQVINGEAELRLDSGDLQPYEDPDALPELRQRKDVVTVDQAGIVQFAPVTNSGLHRVRLSYNEQAVEVQTYVKPDYREWIMVGLAEGTVGHNNVSGNMQNLDDQDIDDKFYKDGRLAFYAKGKIKGKYLLTASYDSDREKPDTANGLFGTIDPDKYYTLYGDATTVRYDAPSSEKLYLRIESDNFYAMFGDYTTGLTVTELGRYSRNLTGLKTEYQDEKVSITAFASQTGQAFVKDEIRGEGTSGLYRLSRQHIVLNSETITIETRDRFRSEVTLSSRQLTRYIDYTFDPVEGTVYFREPVYSRDENFNPVYIVVNYEVISSDNNALTAGARVATRPSEHEGLELGATIVHEGTPGAEAELAGFDARYALNDDTTLKAEVAISTQEMVGSDRMGSAMLAEVATNRDKLSGKAYVRRQESGFGLGQQAGSETGTQKLGADGSYRITENTAVNTEIFRQENIETDAIRDVVNANVEYTQEVYTVSGGMRYARDIDGTGDSHQSTLLTGAARRSFMDKRLALHTRAELAIDDNQNSDYPKRFIAGADYQLTSSTSLFAAQEVTLGENQDSSTTRAGLKATPWKNAAMHTSIEEQQSESGERVFSSMGLTQGIQIDQHLKVDLGIERVVTLRDPGDTPFNVNVPPASGTVSDDFTAVSAGATYRKESWSLTSRAEARYGEQQDKRGLLVGLYRQQAPGFGLSSTLQHFDTDSKAGIDTAQTNLEFSLAYRPVSSQWIILNRARFANESTRSTGSHTRTRKLVNSINANYLYDRRNQVSLMHGIKYVIDHFDGDEYTGLTNLLGIEYRHDIDHRWDVGAQASMLATDVGDNRKYSYGISIGHNLMKNLWISAGLNIDGFRDNDFSNANYTAAGAYLKFRFAFDHLTTREAMAWWEKNK
ncbi:OmpA family protein [Kaarinaea lacus]